MNIARIEQVSAQGAVETLYGSTERQPGAESLENSFENRPITAVETGNVPETKPTEKANAPRGGLRSLTVEELFQLDVKPREMLLHPFLPMQGLSMLYSQRGVGKTFIGLGIAVAVASGGSFLCWNAPKARRVLYVDGEMSLATIRERLASIVSGSKTELKPENIRIITPDVQSRNLPDLSTVSGQDEIEAHLDDVQLLILDNLSALVRTGKENEGEGWLPVQDGRSRYGARVPASCLFTTRGRVGRSGERRAGRICSTPF